MATTHAAALPPFPSPLENGFFDLTVIIIIIIIIIAAATPTFWLEDDEDDDDDDDDGGVHGTLYWGYL